MKQEAFARWPAHALFQLPCACQNLRRLTRIVTRIYDRELRKAGIEITQFGLLTALAIAGEANQKTLSAGFAMDSTTLTRTLALLCRQGWIQVKPGKDRRERVFRLTEAGKRQTAAAQRHWEAAEGAEFLSVRLNQFGPRLSDPQKALYLSAIGLLRAQHASSVSLLHRIGYVKDTIAMLDQAKRLSGGQIFVVNWISGVVRSQLPSFFHQKQAARDDLNWCAANIAKAPDAGWLREVDFRLGTLVLADGDQVKAQDYLRRSGYKRFEKPVVLTTPFSEDTLSGHAFASHRIAEIIPARVYDL